jgi:hypothetical protein
MACPCLSLSPYIEEDTLHYPTVSWGRKETVMYGYTTQDEKE